MFFIDYSSTFNMVITHKLTHKLFRLSLYPTLCDWILDFLIGRPQSVRIGTKTSASITTHTGTPQGCVLSPILSFADDTAEIGRITGEEKATYKREVDRLVA